VRVVPPVSIVLQAGRGVEFPRSCCAILGELDRVQRIKAGCSPVQSS
jgi:hypothetical protein